MEFLDAGQQPSLLFESGSVASGQFQLRNLHHQVFTFWQKLVQRRIEQANGDRIARHLAIEPDEILLLQRQELIEVFFPLLFRPRQDHLLHDRDAILGEEHMFRPAESNPFRPEAPRDLRLIRHVSIGADAELPHAVGP